MSATKTRAFEQLTLDPFSQPYVGAILENLEYLRNPLEGLWQERMLPLEKEIGTKPLSSPRLWQGLQRAQNLNLHNRFPLTGSPYPAKADVLEMHFLLTRTLSA